MAKLTINHLSIFFLALILLTTQATATYNRKIYVKRGQRIQSAIDKAKPGDKIFVARGTYKEQLVITKDDITLIGDGAVLEPPNPYPVEAAKNPCYRLAGNVPNDANEQTNVPTHAGICIFGDVDLLEFIAEHKRVKYPVKRFIKNPTVSGFKVRNFSGLNIAVVGAENARINHNKLVDGLQYGFLTLGSKNTRAEKNIISSTPGKSTFIALCMDDQSDVQIWNNDISGYFTGLCVQTNGADVKGNHVESTCSGIFVDPKIVGAKIRWNHVEKTAKLCGNFPYSSYGIAVIGARDTAVKWNYVEGITDGGNNVSEAVGIAVYDNTQAVPPDVASGNFVTENFLKKNDFDVQVASENGGVNSATKNHCKTGFPVGACVN